MFMLRKEIKMSELESANNYQQIGSTSNAHVGRDFESQENKTVKPTFKKISRHHKKDAAFFCSFTITIYSSF